MNNLEKFEGWFALAVGLGILLTFLYLFLIKKDYFGGFLLMIILSILGRIIKSIYFSLKR